MSTPGKTADTTSFVSAFDCSALSVSVQACFLLVGVILPSQFVRSCMIAALRDISARGVERLCVCVWGGGGGVVCASVDAEAGER